ncbi:UDP-glucuronosyltransferase [Aphelenchoides besseyi]|nr:UDP-glucuronosyltransferase [Aphelenchoides besseyi]
MKIVFYLICFVHFLVEVDGAQILVFAYHDSGSHFKSLGGYLTSLANAGHSVTLVDSIFEEFPFKHPNISRVKITTEYEEVPAYIYWNWYVLSPMMLTTFAHSDLVFGTMLDKYEKEYRDLLTSKWDLVIVDALFSIHGYAIATSLKKRFGTPYVTYETACQLMDWHGAMLSLGWNPVSKAYLYSSASRKVYEPNRLLDRTYAALNSWIEIFGFYYFPPAINYPNMRRFGVDNFYWVDYLNNASLIFLDRIDKFGWIRPSGTELIDIGAKCSQSSSLLPEDLRSFVEDENSKGTIYIAFGTHPNWTKAPDHLLNSFRYVLSRLDDYRVIFSFNGDLSIMPKVSFVKYVKWTPQAAILNHRNTKLFISHVGLKSVKEAICAAVPVLAIPLFAEQPYSGEMVLKIGIGRTLSKYRLNGAQMLNEVHEVLNNPKYANTIRRLSTMFLDLPILSSDLALHKTERLLRVGTDRMAFRRRGSQLKWIEWLYVDLFLIVLSFLFICK